MTNRLFRRRLRPSGLLTMLLLAAIPARAGEGSLVVSTGQYGLRESQPREVGIQLELRPSWQWAILRPVFGALAGTRGAAYVFAGFVLELPLPGGFRLSPGFAPGIVISPGDRDLGSAIEFRSSIELSRPLAPPVRLGISLSHVSNGGLTRRNPGVEAVMFGLAFDSPP